MAVHAKRSTCATGGIEADYNTGLHVAALFIIWFVSSAGCAFPILAIKFPGMRIPRRFFFAVRHFGTGVLIATAFVHLLPTAFVSLHNECLGSFWVNDYEAMPGAIALAAIFLVTVIEMVFHPSRHVKQDKRCYAEQPRRKGEKHVNSTSIAQGLSQLQAAEGQNSTEDEEPPALSPEQKLRKDRLQCILLEMGILFHSVFIGMALSVSIGTDFVVLLIAIVFHRTSLLFMNQTNNQKRLKDLRSAPASQRSNGALNRGNRGLWRLHTAARTSPSTTDTH